MIELLNFATYLFLIYASINLLKMIGLDVKALFNVKIDKNIYFEANPTPITPEAPTIEKNIKYKMNYNDRCLKKFLKHKKIRKKKEYIDNIFDLI